MTTLTPHSPRALRPCAPESFDWQGRTVLLRAVRHGDSALLRVLASHVAAADPGLADRVAGDASALAAGSRSAPADDEVATAFIAVDIDEDGRCEALGLVCASLDDERSEAALAIALRRDVRGRRLGQRLVEKSVDVLRDRGTGEVSVRVPAANETMRTLLRELGFVMDPHRVAPGRVVYALDAGRAVRACPAAA